MQFIFDCVLGMGQDRKRRSLILSLPEAHLLKDRIPRNLRIVYELGYYYAIFTIQKELPSRKPISKILALDPNHKNLGYGVDTEGSHRNRISTMAQNLR